MKDILQDIVSHTHNLGFLNIVKITGDDENTKIDSMAEDRTVIMLGETNAPVPEMKGIFGMPQLNKLKYLLDGSEYKENAKIELQYADRNGVNVPVGIHFENAAGDFKNDYRFMNTEIINEKLKSVKFKVPKWDVELTPSLSAVQRFSFQAGANTEHTTFVAKTDGTNLKFVFGDASTHGGEFIFAQNVSGTLNKGWTWPVAQILSILKIADVNNTKMSFSNEMGAVMITLDSGIATYKYIVPAMA
jgi:hypothetical protein